VDRPRLGRLPPHAAEWADLAAENDGKHRVPTLRNVDKRSGRNTPKAYMHNGAFKSLEEVVYFYATRDVPGSTWPPPEVAENVSRQIVAGKPLGNLALAPGVAEALVAFLKTLTDDPRFAPQRK